MSDHPTTEPAPLPRRLMALLYDLLLGFALVFVAAAIVVLPFSGSMDAKDTLGSQWWFRAYLVVVAVAFPVWFWLRDGQTLGMRTWRLLLVNENGGRPNLPQALTRVAVATLSMACAGLGYMWMLIDAQQRTWHDIASGTRVVQLPKRD